MRRINTWWWGEIKGKPDAYIMNVPPYIHTSYRGVDAQEKIERGR